MIALSDVLSYYGLKIKPNIQLLQGVRGGGQVIVCEENYRRLGDQIPTLNPNKKFRYRYRTRPGLSSLKPNPTFGDDRKLGAKTK